MSPPPPVQLTVFHEPLVLHDQIEVAFPLDTVLVSATNDTRACMDRLEQRFRHMRIFDGVTSYDDINVCAPHSPIDRFMISMFNDHDLDERYQSDYDHSIIYERVLYAYDDPKTIDLGIVIGLED